MKKITLTILGVYFAALAISQNSEVIASSGESLEQGNLKVEFTIGETIIATHSGNNNELTQGFHQSNLVVTKIKEISPLSIQVFPNPTQDIITISSEENKNFQINLTNLNGQLLQQVIISQNTTSLDLSALPAGIYLLQAIDQQQTVKTYKINKIQ